MGKGSNNTSAPQMDKKLLNSIWRRTSFFKHEPQQFGCSFLFGICCARWRSFGRYLQPKWAIHKFLIFGACLKFILWYTFFGSPPRDVPVSARFRGISFFMEIAGEGLGGFLLIFPLIF